MTNAIRRFTLACLVAAGILVGTMPTASQAADATSIAVFNLDTIMKDSTAQKSLREQMEAKQKSFKASLDKKEETLQKENQELAKQRSVLSPEAFEKKNREFGTKFTAAQKEMGQSRETLEKGYAQAMNEFRLAMIDVAANVAKAKGVSIIMPNTQLMYADPKLDVTDDMLKGINEKLPKITVKF